MTIDTKSSEFLFWREFEFFFSFEKCKNLQKTFSPIFSALCNAAAISATKYLQRHHHTHYTIVPVLYNYSKISRSRLHLHNFYMALAHSLSFSHQLALSKILPTYVLYKVHKYLVPPPWKLFEINNIFFS